MRLRLILGGTLLAVITATAQTQNLGGDLQRAKQREVNEGCNAALPDYERIAQQGVKSDRPSAAEALLRAAMCHEREGRTSDARAAYSRILSEFVDVRAVAAIAKDQSAVLPDGRGAVAAAERPPFQSSLGDFLRRLDGPARLSPNGRFVAYASAQKGLSVHSISAGSDLAMAGMSPSPASAVYVVWSPDSSAFAFYAFDAAANRGVVRVANVLAGKVQTIDSWPGDAVAGQSPAWSADSQYVAFIRARQRDGDGPCSSGQAAATACIREIRIGSANGSSPAMVAGVSDLIPTFLWSPVGHELVHTIARSTDLHFVTPGKPGARVVPLGRVIGLHTWTRDGAIWARSGNEVVRFAASGGEVTAAASPGDSWLGATPDGSSSLIRKTEAGRLVLRQTSDGSERPLTTGAGSEVQAMLSPDGRLVFFASNREGRWAYYVVPTEAAPAAKPLRLTWLDGAPTPSPSTVSGQWAAIGLLIASTPFRESHIARLRLDPASGRPDQQAERISVSWPETFMPVPSPSGTELAVNTSGHIRPAIAIVAADGSRERILIEHERAKLRWRSAGELLYSTGFSQWALGPAFHTLNAVTGAKGRPPFPDLPIDPARDRLIDWDYVPTTDEVLYVTGPAMPNPNALPRSGPYSFRLHSLRDGQHRVLATRDRFDFPDGTIRVSPDGRFAAHTSNGALAIIDLKNPAAERTLAQTPGRLLTLSWSPDNRHVFACNLLGRCSAVAVDTGESWPLTPASPDSTWRWSDAEWSPDGTTAYVARGGVRNVWFSFDGVTYDAVKKLMKGGRP